MAVAITENWWKTLWSKKLGAEPLGPDSKLVDAIKAYKRSLRGKRRGDVLDALDALTDELCDCTRRNLKRRDLNAEQKRVLDAKLGEALTHVAEKRKAAENASGGVKTVYKINFQTVIDRVYKGPLTIKADRDIEMKMLDIVIDELAASGSDAMLHAEIDKHVEAAAKDYAEKVETFFDGNTGKLDRKRMDAVCKKLADNAMRELDARLARVPTDIMKKVRVHREIARKYRKEKAISISKGVAGATMGVGGVFVPGNTPFAAVMAARSCASLANDIYEVSKSLKFKVKALDFKLKKLARAYDSHKGEKEIALDTLNAVLGVDVMPTVDGAKAQLEDIRKDMATTAHRARVANKKVLRAMDSMEKIEKKVNRSSVTGIRKGALKMKLGHARRDLDDMADSVYRLNKHVRIAEDKIPELKQRLDEIGTFSGRVDKAKVAIRGAISIGTALGGVGDASAASQMASTVEKVSALGLAFEGAMEDIKDTLDNVNSVAS